MRRYADQALPSRWQVAPHAECRPRACFMVSPSEAMVKKGLYPHVNPPHLLFFCTGDERCQTCVSKLITPANIHLAEQSSTPKSPRPRPSPSRQAELSMAVSILPSSGPAHTPCGLGPLDLADTQTASGHQTHPKQNLTRKRARYTKSKKGCRNCVERHLRCDENWPRWSVSHLPFRRRHG